MAVNKLIVISNKCDFDRLRNQGKKVRNSSKYFITILVKNEHDYPRFAWTISGKVGSAVTRNKFKRWFRVVLRNKLNDGFILPYDINFIIKPVNHEFYKKFLYKDFLTEINQIFEKIN